MPIPQQRMINVIQTALTYRSAYQKLTQEINLQLANSQIQNNPKLTTTLETISIFAPILPEGLTLEQDITLLMEHKHFERVCKANDRRANRVRRLRKTRATYDTQTTQELSGNHPEKELF